MGALRAGRSHQPRASQWAGPENSPILDRGLGSLTTHRLISTLLLDEGVCFPYMRATLYRSQKTPRDADFCQRSHIAIALVCSVRTCTDCDLLLVCT